MKPKPLSPRTPKREREKAKRKADKEAGVDKQVQRKKKIMEDHYADCGDDMSSLHDVDTVGFTCFDSDDTLSDEDHDHCLKAEFRQIKSSPSSTRGSTSKRTRHSGP